VHNFLLASGNEHKKEEFLQLFAGSNISVKSPPGSLEVDETGTSFEENAFLKAQAFYDNFKGPVISDDSGLVVSALPGELGVYSARFGGEGLNDEQRARLLLEKLEGESERSAYFVCYLCFYCSPREVFFFEGRLKGTILGEYRPGGGFGYDPVFSPLEREFMGLSVAEKPEWKQLNSHRALAVKSAKEFFFQRDCQKT